MTGPGVSPRILHLSWGRMEVEGLDGRLRVDQTTVKLLEAAGFAVHQGLTPHAVEVYNTLAETTPVAGLFHATC